VSREFDLAPGLRIEQRIDAAEADGIRERWEFGRWMLGHVPEDGKKLPTGFLGGLAKATGKGLSELKYRRQFAENFPSEEALATAVAKHHSWTGIRDAMKAERELPPPLPAPDLPDGRFSVLLADPPWRYEQGGSTPNRRVENHYPTMSVEEICALEVPAADDAVLFLWAVNPLLFDAGKVMEAWGFEYRTGFVWVKTNGFGTGHWVRQRHEQLLVGRKGDMRTPCGALPDSVIEAPRREHSRKPDEAYEVIEQMYPGFKRVELFARRPRAGWTVWGNEVGT